MVVLGKRNAGAFYLPRRFGAVCGYQGSGHGYLAISAYQIQPGLSPCDPPCNQGRQTWPAWELPYPWERLSRPSPAPELVQVPPGNVLTGLGIGLTSPGPAGQRQLRRISHPRLCSGSFAGPSCRHQVVRCYSASTQFLASSGSPFDVVVRPAGWVAEVVLPSVETISCAARRSECPQGPGCKAVWVKREFPGLWSSGSLVLSHLSGE